MPELGTGVCEIVQPIGDGSGNPALVILPIPNERIVTDSGSRLAIVASVEHGDVKQMSVCGLTCLIHRAR